MEFWFSRWFWRFHFQDGKANQGRARFVWQEGVLYVHVILYIFYISRIGTGMFEPEWHEGSGPAWTFVVWSWGFARHLIYTGRPAKKFLTRLRKCAGWFKPSLYVVFLVKGHTNVLYVYFTFIYMFINRLFHFCAGYSSRIRCRYLVIK